MKMLRLTLTVRPKQNFLRYIDAIVRTLRGGTKELLDEVNNLHPSLQFILEITDDKNSLPFVDNSNNVPPEGTIFLHKVSKTIRYWNNSKILLSSPST